MYTPHFNTLEALEQFLREPLASVPQRNSFPPYNVYTSKDGNVTKIDIAVAGFRQDDIEIEVADGKLIISGNKEAMENDEWELHHRGIAGRKFNLLFHVNRNFEADSAELNDGILTVTLKKIAGFAKKLTIGSNLREVQQPQLLKEAA